MHVIEMQAWYCWEQQTALYSFVQNGRLAYISLFLPNPKPLPFQIHKSYTEQNLKLRYNINIIYQAPAGAEVELQYSGFPVFSLEIF